jgi:hypothetical protein
MLTATEKLERIARSGEHCPVCYTPYSLFYHGAAPACWEVNIACDHLRTTQGRGGTVDAQRVLGDPASWRWDS